MEDTVNVLTLTLANALDDLASSLSDESVAVPEPVDQAIQQNYILTKE